MDELQRITRKRKEAYTWFLAHGSKGYEAVAQMEADVYPDGAISRKNKELMATAIAALINCQSCMQWHIEKAAEEGATIAEIIEAIDVAIEFGAGPVTVAARFAMDVIKDVYGEDA
ncbi:carboxymuconolactone decarboxylase family protein [Candidatus Bipolaricaulota bacterium]|nr:carboxymuconolactone decarboxylase family protein [Candidatus Bipolaricaulota bacterium]